MITDFELFESNRIGLYGLINHSGTCIPMDYSQRKKNKMHLYHRIIRKLDNLMTITIVSDDMYDASTRYWRMIEELENWMQSFHNLQFYVHFKIIFSAMLIATVKHLSGKFPELKQSFKSLENYPRVNRSVWIG
jgi:hypothetical protein